jgi:toxin ParE1/3/4
LSGCASRCLIATIFSAISKLKVRVHRGRPGRIDGTRELVIPRTPYVAAYLVDADTVRILRVLHGAQMWPDEFPAED